MRKWIKYSTKFKLLTSNIITVKPDDNQMILKIPELSGLSGTYFLDLRLFDADGEQVSSNFYWLSTNPDLLDEKHATWYVTPTESFADLTELQNLPGVKLKMESKFKRNGDVQTAYVVVENPTDNPAFFVHLLVTKGKDGDPVLPIYWDDNYFTLAF